LRLDGPIGGRTRRAARKLVADEGRSKRERARGAQTGEFRQRSPPPRTAGADRFDRHQRHHVAEFRNGWALEKCRSHGKRGHAEQLRTNPISASARLRPRQADDERPRAQNAGAAANSKVSAHPAQHLRCPKPIFRRGPSIGSPKRFCFSADEEVRLPERTPRTRHNTPTGPPRAGEDFRESRFTAMAGVGRAHGTPDVTGKRARDQALCPPARPGAFHRGPAISAAPRVTGHAFVAA